MKITTKSKPVHVEPHKRTQQSHRDGYKITTCRVPFEIRGEPLV